MNVLKLVRFQSTWGEEWYRAENFMQHNEALKHMIGKFGFGGYEIQYVRLMARMHGLRLEIREAKKSEY